MNGWLIFGAIFLAVVIVVVSLALGKAAGNSTRFNEQLEANLDINTPNELRQMYLTPEEVRRLDYPLEYYWFRGPHLTEEQQKKLREKFTKDIKSGQIFVLPADVERIDIDTPESDALNPVYLLDDEVAPPGEMPHPIHFEPTPKPYRDAKGRFAKKPTE